MQTYINEAKSAGIECCFDGSRDMAAVPRKGYFVPPFVFVDPPSSSRVWTEEIFGPVLCVKVFDSEEEAVHLANDTMYGLAAAVFSSDPIRCERVSCRLRVGIMWVNCSQPAFISAPWGGCKGSGFGRELGKWGVEEFIHVKQVTSCSHNFSWSLW